MRGDRVNAEAMTSWSLDSSGQGEGQELQKREKWKLARAS